MKVVLTDFAKQQMRLTAKYIQYEFGKKRRDLFVQEIRNTGQLLRSNPSMGIVEPLLADLPSNYRSIVVNKINKVVYRVLEDRIEISDIWDVRRNPETLAKQIK